MSPLIKFHIKIYFPKHQFDLASCLKVPIARGTRLTEGKVALKDDDWSGVDDDNGQF